MTFVRLLLLQLLLIGALQGSLQAQSVSFAPLSFKSLGSTPSMGAVTVEHKGFGLHYFYNYTEKVWTDGEVQSNTRSAFGLSYAPLRRDWVQAGAILFHRSFPVEKAVQFNFYFELGWMFGPVGVYYRHVSNGFGLLHDVNPGVDHILMRVQLR